jgi:hypothetical protein
VKVPDAVFVPVTFAGEMTFVVSVSLSLPVFGSAVAEVTVAVFEITVPASVFPATLTTSVNTALPIAMLGFEHVT